MKFCSIDKIIDEINYENKINTQYILKFSQTKAEIIISNIPVRLKDEIESKINDFLMNVKIYE